MKSKKLTNGLCVSLMLQSLLLCVVALDAKGAESEDDNKVSVELSTRIKSGVIQDSDRSLGRETVEDNTILFAAVQPKLTASYGESWGAFAFAELLVANDIVASNEDLGSDQSKEYALLRELWFDYKGLSRYPGESLRLGLERLREPSALWWDREVLTARWRIDTTRLQATFGAGERMNTISSDETDLRPEDNKRRRYFSSLDYQWHYNHWFGFKAMHSVDQEDAPGHTSNTNLFERQFSWFGLSANNSYQNTAEDLPVQYSVDVMGLWGRAEYLNEQDEKHDIDVSGWAIDFGLRRRFNVQYPFVIGAHVAFASGDDDETDNGTFYQTGLHTNRNRFSGTRSIVSRFGEAARLELSNVKVISVYLSQGVGRSLEWSVVAHQFTRANENQSIQLDGLSVNPNSDDNDIGSELDLLVAYFHSAKRGTLAGFSTKLRAGYFEAGDAYAAWPNDERYRVSLSLEKQF